MWTTVDLHNESDVEQKFLYPLLVQNPPLGLGLPAAVILTKRSIRRLQIGKGSEKKLYFPDYLIVTMGYPLVVIEAKSPRESTEEAYREARLYAAELNALYGHDFAPAKFIIASNGVELWYGHSDDTRPLDQVQCEALGPYSSAIAELVELMAWRKLHSLAAELAQKTRPSELFKARRLLGGTGLQSEEVGINSFGATLTTLISPIFNPTTEEERANIARNAYVPSKRRERYIDPIDRVIRAARPPSELRATPFEDTANPDELINKLKGLRSLEHKVLLLIGSVGSGKSTFVDYLIEVALPKELLDSTVWCRINMNAAPVSSDEIYRWLRRQIISGCKASLPDLDFDELKTVQKIFGIEIQKFRKGIGQLYGADPNVYDIKLAEHIDQLLADQETVANAYVRFSCAQRGKLLLVVLDNCDKKTRDEQLLMFEAAHWLQKEFRCLVILPLRDETYDNHRNQPPLDTALKDLVFRIEPPLFQQVLMRRIQYALRELPDSGDKLSFELPNGFHVEYPPSDQAYYLTSIVKSLFEHDRFARRMIVGLSGRNMRRALEIFLELCSSGHIGEDQIFRIRQSRGHHTLPFHQVATVLIRMNRRFYDSDYSYVKNVFAASRDDPQPSFFCRYMILQWLRIKFRSSGTAGLRGYFKKREIKSILMPFGLDPDILDRELNYLLSAQCIIAEHLRLDSLDDEDLVRLGPAGFVHLDLVGNVNYLAAVAEDTWFADRLQAESVANRIRELDTHLHLKTVTNNANEVVTYLESLRPKIVPPNGQFVEGDLLDKVTTLEPSRDALTRIQKSRAGDPWFNADRRLKRGSVHQAIVQNVVEFGCFVEFNDGLVGLIHKSKLGEVNAFAGDRVEVKVLWVDVIQHRIGLQLLAVVDEDVGDAIEGTHVQTQHQQLFKF